MKHLAINQETEAQQQEKELQRLEIKHVEKTKYHRMKPFANLCNWVAYFVQLNSFALAALGVSAYLWLEMGNKAFPLILLTILFFVLVEMSVSVSWKTFGAMKFDDGVVSPVIYVGMVVSLAISTPSTYYFTPHAIQVLTPSPLLLALDSVEAEQDIKTHEDTSYWHDQRYTNLSAASLYFDKYRKKDCNTCPWRLSTAKHINAPHGALTATAKAAQDSINKFMVQGQSEKKSAIYSASLVNTLRVDAHKEWCASFGGILAWASVGGILLLIPCRLFFEYWERKYKQDLRGEVKRSQVKVVPEAKVLPSVLKDTGKDKGEGKSKVVESQPSTPIGFTVAASKEGDILKGEGRKKDRVMVIVGGDLRPCTFGELNTLIKGQTTAVRIEHLETLKNKLK